MTPAVTLRIGKRANMVVETTDRELVERALTGHEGAFREIVERYQRPIFSLIYRMVRDRELAEDLSQETFVRAWDRIERFDPTYKFSSWIFKIAHNLTIDQLRRRTVETLSMDGASNSDHSDEIARTRIDLASPDADPEEVTSQRQLARILNTAVSALRPEYRSVIELRHGEGLDYSEIAEVMGLPLGTIKTYLHRARHQLRTSLAALES